MSDFELHSRLATDSVFVADGPLSQFRLMNDERYPWLLLVPRLDGVTEWIDLDGEQQNHLRTELNRASKALKSEPEVQKLNIGALGNIVPQLHFHVIGRHEGDPAWPGPVWGSGQAHRHDADELQRRVAHWKDKLGYPPHP